MDYVRAFGMVWLMALGAGVIGISLMILLILGFTLIEALFPHAGGN